MLLIVLPQHSSTHLQVGEIFGSFWLQFSTPDLKRDLFTTIQCNRYGRKYLVSAKTSKTLKTLISKLTGCVYDFIRQKESNS